MNKVYEIVTERIIKQMEAGIVPWHQGWIADNSCVSYTTGKPYSILNQMLLGERGEYITFKQVKALGGKVKKGAKSKVVVFWKMMEKPTGEVNDKGEIEVELIPILRYYNVFNINDCEGIEPKHADKYTMNEDFEPIAEAEQLIAAYIKREGIKTATADYAAYIPRFDRIMMPEKKQFESEAEYYGTYCHEMIHSTGAKKRLNRIDETACFGSDNYSKEELVAEIGSAFIMNELHIEGGFNNSVAYIQGWMQRLKEDPRLIVTAAGKAEKAVKYIKGAE